MEKIVIAISIIFHDEGFSFLVCGVIGFVLAFWHTFYPFRMRELREAELVKISPVFEGIDGQHIQTMFLWFAVTIILFFSKLDDWAISKYGVRFYPIIVIILAGYGFFQALFALGKGVYPQAKSLTYIYGDEKKIRRIAKFQIAIAVVVSILSIVVFNILGAYFKVE